jgi:hypothetical protein
LTGIVNSTVSHQSRPSELRSHELFQSEKIASYGEPDRRRGDTSSIGQLQAFGRALKVG